LRVRQKAHDSRPGLLKARETCRRRRTTLLIARLDRLAHYVAFIGNLVISDVELVAVDIPRTDSTSTF